MSQPIKLDDGTVVWVRVRPGAKLTKKDITILTEFVKELRERKDDKKQTSGQRPPQSLPGHKKRKD